LNRRSTYAGRSQASDKPKRGGRGKKTELLKQIHMSAAEKFRGQERGSNRTVTRGGMNVQGVIIKKKGKLEGGKTQEPETRKKENERGGQNYRQGQSQRDGSDSRTYPSKGKQGKKNLSKEAPKNKRS